MQNWKKLLSLLLVLTMLVGMMPAVFAAEEEPAAEPEQAEEILPEEPADPEIPDAPEVPADPDMPDDPDTPDDPADPADPAEPADPDAPAEPEDPEVPEEPEDPEEPEEEPEEEEEEPSELPYGFPGMGEGYELSEEELAAKLALAGLPEALAGMTPGADYVEGELIVAAATEEYAQQTADAYNAELLDYGYGFALIRLREATVLQAVECAADPEIPLPAVEPNLLAPTVQAASAGADFSVQGEVMDYSDWASSDPYLNPSSYAFQYHHFIMDDYATWGAYTGTGYYGAILMLSSTGVYQSSPEFSGNVSGDSASGNTKGTELAKLAVGTLDNGVEGAGVAPGAKLYCVQVNSIYQVASTLNTYAGSSTARVILIDFAFPWTAQSLETAVKNVVSKGGVIVAPMGDYGNSTRCYPAAYDGVVAVAATDSSGALARYSCNGAWCTISAPGDTCYGSGTSYAAALVAGAAFLYHKVNGYPYDMSGFVKQLKKGATPGGAGAGIMNTANLFGGKPAAPVIKMDSDGGFYDGTRVDGYGRFWFTDPDLYGEGDNKTVLFTLDGTTPSVKNGEYKHGDERDFNNSESDSNKEKLAWYFGGPIEKPTIGKTYTIKAITVNGMGIPSAVSTCKFKLAGTTKNVTLTLEGPSEIIAGQSAAVKAVAENEYGYPVAQDFEWQLYSDCGATLSNGKLTTKKNKLGTINLHVHLKNTDKYASLSITVNNPTPVVESIKLKDKYYWDASSQVLKPFTLMVGDTCDIYPDARDKGNINVNPAAQYVWTSSNEDVLKVTYVDTVSYHYCSIKAVGPGTAVLKATAQDGSNKSASIKVTVNAKVTSIYIWPKDYRYYIAPGGSVTMGKSLYPSNAADKSVHWSAWGNYSQIPIDQKALKKGIIKLDKGYTPTHEDEKITVQCSSSDYSANYDVVIYIVPKVTAMTVTSKYGDPLKTVTLCTESLGANADRVSLKVVEEYYLNGSPTTRINGNYNSYDWRTLNVEISNLKVAAWYNGTVYAMEPGTAKITVTSSDGVKKFSFNVKVVVPVSDVEIRSAAPGGANTVAYGKSFKMKAATKSLYGKPTDSKMNWQIYFVDCYDGSCFYGPEAVKSVLSLSQNGVLSTKAAAASFHGGIRYVHIRVTPQNYSGSSLYGEYLVYLGNPIDKITTYSLGPDNAAHLYGNAPFTVYLDMYDKTGTPISYYGQPENFVTVTSSNPKLLSAMVSSVGSYGDYCNIELLATDPEKLTAKEQSAKVTVKFNDGSNKSFTFTVKLQA